MKSEHAAAGGMVASALLTLLTGHFGWLVALLLCGMAYGWQLGKRHFPAGEV